ncbi:M23 family metallopeptidase [Bacillus sp. Marseille-P3661]|uniref:M23 family metallopeptidase n=1 Tax=Bacillus sp. Marseille-P3661 TaxID=1936234 RepID=UPI000C817765|nr:M23 family metallopeptidase [Bacillus sp. Marseille-P3661]
MREEEKLTSQGSKWRKVLRKRWVLPAVYIGSAAILLTGVLWFQAATNNDVADENQENVTDSAEYAQYEDAVPVNAQEENFKMPVVDENAVTIKKQFYDNDASSEEQEAALVFYNNTYYPSTGIDIAMESGESFDVVASLSGTVVRAENDSLLGNVVEIEHEDGIATFYQSLGEVHVEAGAFVDQGEVIGTAGSSVYNKDAGTHVHFEIRQNNEPVNPIEFFNKPLSSIKEAAETEETEKATEETEKATEESAEQPAEESEKAPEQSTEQPKEDKAAEESSKQPADESSDQPADDSEKDSEKPAEGEESTNVEQGA